MNDKLKKEFWDLTLKLEMTELYHGAWAKWLGWFTKFINVMSFTALLAAAYGVSSGGKYFSENQIAIAVTTLVVAALPFISIIWGIPEITTDHIVARRLANEYLQEARKLEFRRLEAILTQDKLSKKEQKDLGQSFLNLAEKTDSLRNDFPSPGTLLLWYYQNVVLVRRGLKNRLWILPLFWEKKNTTEEKVIPPPPQSPAPGK